MAASKKTLKAKADKLAGQSCRARGYCESAAWFGRNEDPENPIWSEQRRHQCSNRLEWAHIKSRGYCSIRHDPKNCVCLCNICHRYFTQNPDEWKRFIDWLDPDRWDYLNKQLWQQKNKPDYQFWIDYYLGAK